jgi:hypothetical protein
MKVGDSTSRGYTLGTFGAYPAYRGRDQRRDRRVQRPATLNLSKSGTKKCPPS